MKRQALPRHLGRYGCYLKIDGSYHTLWTNPIKGSLETVQKHSEILDKLTRKIYKDLDIPDIKK